MTLRDLRQKEFADEYEEYSVNTPDLKQVDTAEEYYYKKNK